MTPDRNTEAEYSIIGAICLDQRVVDKIAAKVKPEDFTISACASVYEAAVDATERGKAFDHVVAIDVLKRNMDAQSAAELIVECVNMTPTTANAELHAKLVHKYAGLRRLKLSAEEALLNANDPNSMASDMIKLGQDFLQQNKTSNRVSLTDVLVEMHDDLKRTDAIGIKTGFPKFDSIVNGAEAGELIIVAARPGVGKTAFGMEWALSSASQGYGTDFYSLEMPRVQLAKRMTSRISTVGMGRIFKRELEEEDWKLIGSSSNRLSKYPLYIFDDPYMTVSKIRTNSITTKNLGLIVIDYLQLMCNDRHYDKRVDAVGENSMALKRLAKELGVPIVALAQLNRNVDEYSKPTMSCLRECGNIEMDADKIIFLWREDEEPGDLIRVGNAIAKCRNGQQATLVFNFNGPHMRFIETNEKYEPPKQKRRFVLNND